MATYIHSKMAANANKGHRRWGHINNAVGREKTDDGRPKRLGRNGSGNPFVRFVDGLRTRYRQAVDLKAATLLKRRGFRTAERLFRFNTMKFGGSLGTSYDDEIRRSNISAGDKSKIRIT